MLHAKINVICLAILWGWVIFIAIATVILEKINWNWTCLNPFESQVRDSSSACAQRRVSRAECYANVCRDGRDALRKRRRRSLLVSRWRLSRDFSCIVQDAGASSLSLPLLTSFAQLSSVILNFLLLFLPLLALCCFVGEWREKQQVRNFPVSPSNQVVPQYATDEEWPPDDPPYARAVRRLYDQAVCTASWIVCALKR